MTHGHIPTDSCRKTKNIEENDDSTILLKDMFPFAADSGWNATFWLVKPPSFLEKPDPFLLAIFDGNVYETNPKSDILVEAPIQ